MTLVSPMVITTINVILIINVIKISHKCNKLLTINEIDFNHKCNEYRNPYESEFVSLFMGTSDVRIKIKVNSAWLLFQHLDR